MNNEKKLIIVCVTYGKFRFCKNNIINIANGKNYEYIIIDNKYNEITYNEKKYSSESNNEFFEFSGYQAGINFLNENKKILNDCVDLCIINDTIFESHLTLLFKKMIDYCFHIEDTVIDTLFGLVEKRYFGKIIPSCFFYFKIEKNNIIKLNFLGLLIKDYASIEKNDIEKLEYFNNEVNKWLYPKSLLKGWYKSVPWEKIDNKTYERKRLAINLEYGFLKNNPWLNCVELNNVKLSIRIYKILDKILCNILKIKFRISRLKFKYVYK